MVNSDHSQPRQACRLGESATSGEESRRDAEGAKRLMPRWGEESRQKLAQVHPAIVRVLNVGIQRMDMTVVSGARVTGEQKELFRKGLSKLDGVSRKSKHQAAPMATAVDVVPYPMRWPDEHGLSDGEIQDRLRRFYVMGGFLVGIGEGIGVQLRWGGDWDMDWEYKDQTFDDLGHVEMV